MVGTDCNNIECMNPYCQCDPCECKENDPCPCCVGVPD